MQALFWSWSKIKCAARASPSLAPSHLQNAVAWGVESWRGWGGSSYLHLWGCASLTSPFSRHVNNQSSHLVGPCGLQPLCHWVGERYGGIWSPSSLFKNGAVPHRASLRGVGYYGGGGPQREQRVIKVRAWGQINTGLASGN